MKTRRFCPHCGRPVLKSLIKGYSFQCYNCDEDFYKFEVLRIKDIEKVRILRKQTIMHERQQGYTNHSVYKPWPKNN